MALAAVPLAVSLRAVVHYSLEVVQSAESSLVAVEVEVRKPSLILSVSDLVAAIALGVQQLILEVVVPRTPCQSSLVILRQS